MPHRKHCSNTESVTTKVRRIRGGPAHWGLTLGLEWGPQPRTRGARRPPPDLAVLVQMEGARTAWLRTTGLAPCMHVGSQGSNSGMMALYAVVSWRPASLRRAERRQARPPQSRPFRPAAAHCPYLRLSEPGWQQIMPPSSHGQRSAAHSVTMVRAVSVPAHGYSAGVSPGGASPSVMKPPITLAPPRSGARTRLVRSLVQQLAAGAHGRSHLIRRRPAPAPKGEPAFGPR